ncbi:MAG: hypothetical protein OQL19_16905 [Gammaproteobacteria bacterium]|nr:hypothetical protein [Gammaproteobacteria bacterium]
MKRAASSLTFIVPGLIDPVPYLNQLPVQDLPQLPLFSTVLSRGNFSTSEHIDTSPNNFYSNVMKEFKSMDDFRRDAPHLPIASLSYFSDVYKLSESERLNLGIKLVESIENKWIMRADPSFLVADRDQLVLARTGSLDISIEEAKQLAEEINQFFDGYQEENFWTLKVVSPDRWYIVSDKPISIQSVPPENVLGQPIRSFLFNDKAFIETSSINESVSHWLNLFNEFQMILHKSDINKKRIELKKTPINSLWFWGAGQGVCCSNFDICKDDHKCFYSNHQFVQQLAALQNFQCDPLPKVFVLNARGQKLNENTPDIIYTIEDFDLALKNKDVFTWVGLLEQFEKNYLVHILNGLDSGTISQVKFISPSGRHLLFTKKLLKRWWKKKQQYHSILCASMHF